MNAGGFYTHIKIKIDKKKNKKRLQKITCIAISELTFLFSILFFYLNTKSCIFVYLFDTNGKYKKF